LEAQECSSNGTEWESVDLCDVGGLQCSPLGGRCITLDIDATEVTRQEYGQFLAANTDIDDQPDGCSWNSSFEPDADCMSDPRTCSDDCDDHPQVCVDFCDAAAYCASVGKRLCGGIETGDTVEFESDVSDPGRSEWMNACTSGGQTVFGYGDPLPETEVGACTYDNRLMTTYAVGSRGDCISDRNGYAGTADMSGNVAEWENNCEAALSGGDANTPCHVRGGSFESPLDDIKCKNVPSIPSVRSTVSPTIGLRCCSD
jgi:formylglycine-generating enzyme required for sulfatase activity